MTANLNKVIDVNYYPVETAKRSNLQHRAIGIGVQGLADTFILLGMPFESPEVIAKIISVLWVMDFQCAFGNYSSFLFQARQLNKDIFETIYYHALKASSEISVKEGPYETYQGSPVSKVHAFPSTEHCNLSYTFC